MKKKAKKTKISVEHGKMSDLLFRLEASVKRADQFQAEAKRHEANLIAICLAIGFQRPIEQYSNNPTEFNHIAFAKLPYMVAELRGFKEGIGETIREHRDEVDFLRKMVAVGMKDPTVVALAEKIASMPLADTLRNSNRNDINPDIFIPKR